MIQELGSASFSAQYIERPAVLQSNLSLYTLQFNLTHSLAF